MEMTPISDLSGVYKIQNQIDGKIYIGSAHNLKFRWRTHKASLKSQSHKNSRLQNAVNKHGIENFSFTPVLICDKSNVLLYEQIILNFYLNKTECYNLCTEVVGGSGWNHSDDAKEKMKQAWKHRIGKPLSEETKEKISAANKGRKRAPLSEETKQKMSEAHKGKKLGSYSEEHRRKISEATKGRKPPSLSQEAREKIRLAHVGAKRSEQARANMRAGWARKKLEKQNEHL